ncbi:hypothetical protein N431DRAFT_430335 [Stipitochalara longipes BDJ]|nr:hypothetical protein N431DRAFT_430335 [Stipitochalara longipes BDJ]
MFYGLINIPDFRPSQAHPLHRAKRKAIERANPHFDLKDAGLKAAVLAILAAIACYPRIKAEHDMKHHPERFENNRNGKEKERGDKGYETRRSEGYNRERVGSGDRYRKLESGERRSDGWDRRLEGGSGRRR